MAAHGVATTLVMPQALQPDERDWTGEHAAGVLAEWDGDRWTVLERTAFMEVAVRVAQRWPRTRGSASGAGRRWRGRTSALRAP
jgi:hypothetical protein